MGMIYWQAEVTKHWEINNEDEEDVCRLPAEATELEAKRWIEGFVNGVKRGIQAGRAMKAAEVRKVLGEE
jgi:hypothetical protein